MMKFYAGVTKGVSATQIKATDLLSIALDKNTSVEAIVEATGGMKVLELINNALSESRAAYAITSPINVVKETIAKVLQAKFMDRINILVETVEGSDIDALNDYVEGGRISRDVVEYVTDLVEARRIEHEAPVVEVQPVTIDAGINLTADQVLKMMAGRGLVIGGSCTAAMGTGTVLGFVVGQIGTMVVMSIEGKQLTVMATKVQGTEGNTGVFKAIDEHVEKKAQELASKQTKTNEEVSVSMKNNNQSNVVTSAPSLQFVAPVVNEEAKAVVESAVEGNVVPYYELTPEERAAAEEAKLQADLAKFTANQEEKSASASVVANSSAAQALKALGGATQTAKANVAPAATGAPVVAPNQGRQAAQTNNNRGGNVQMANQTQVNGAAQGRQGSAFTGQSASGRQASTPSLVLGGGAGVAPAVGGAWADVAPVMDLPTQEFTGNNAAGGQDFVWYIAEAAKYEGQILDLATLAANGFANPEIGITGMKFCTPASVASFFNREVKQDDFMWVEVFFGTTSYEFMFSKNSSSDKSRFIYSRNISRKQTKGGTWYCEYVTSRRSDKLQVVQQADGVIREARKAWNRDNRAFEIVAEDAPYVVEVGGQSWVNTAPNYGIRVGQQVFVQLMVMFDEQQGLKAARDAK